jgi:hypothetical protein
MKGTAQTTVELEIIDQLWEIIPPTYTGDNAIAKLTTGSHIVYLEGDAETLGDMFLKAAAVLLAESSTSMPMARLPRSSRQDVA